MTDQPMIYEAQIDFVRYDEEEKRYYEFTKVIQFLSDSDTKAIHDTLKWAENRHSAIPKHFAKLGAFTLWVRGFSRMDEKGYLAQEKRRYLMVWKEGHVRSTAEHLVDMKETDLRVNMPIVPDPLGL